MNFSDAEITSLYVSDPGVPVDIQNDAPNAPAGGTYNVTLEMVAGAAVVGLYDLHITCSDLSATAPAPAVLIPGGPLNGPGAFAPPAWVAGGPLLKVFNHTVVVGPLPAPDKGHVFQYTASLHSNTGQIVSIKQSDPFILL